jgi:NAD-dependent deacetylase
MVAAAERNKQRLVILTGAGISADSGVPTFRAADGLWEGHRVEDVATPEAFVRDPALVHAFYDARRANLAAVEPNPAHLALAELERRWGGDFLLVTQNVDDLHERAGSQRLIHMHGELKRGWCLACDQRFPLGRADGGGRALPMLRHHRPGPPRHRLVRRDAL